MEDNMTVLRATSQDMEITADPSRKTLSFRTTEGEFTLTDAQDDNPAYYEVSDASYEDEGLFLYFSADARFQGEYDVVILNCAMDENITDFLAGYLFLGTPLILSLNPDSKKQMH